MVTVLRPIDEADIQEVDVEALAILKALGTIAETALKTRILLELRLGEEKAEGISVEEVALDKDSTEGEPTEADLADVAVIEEDLVGVEATTVGLEIQEADATIHSPDDRDLMLFTRGLSSIFTMANNPTNPFEALNHNPEPEEATFTPLEQ